MTVTQKTTKCKDCGGKNGWHRPECDTLLPERPAPPVVPGAGVAKRSGANYAIHIEMAGLTINGEPMDNQAAADALADTLEAGLQKRRRRKGYRRKGQGDA